MLSRTRRILALITLILLAANAQAAEQKWTRELAKGITLTQIARTPGPKDPSSSPQFINVLVVDPKVPGVEVHCGDISNAVKRPGK